MTTLIERCREYGHMHIHEHVRMDSPERRTLREAADEIERLRSLLTRVEKSITDHNEDRLEYPVESRCDWDFGEGHGGTLDYIRRELGKTQ